MATISGNDGQVKIGTNLVTEVTDFSVNTNAELMDDTVKGDTWKSHVVGRNDWSGSVSVFYDVSDTNGQVAMTEGASVVLHLLPEGSATGDQDINGTATINSVAIGSPNGNIVTAQFTFTGNGAMTRGTVA